VELRATQSELGWFTAVSRVALTDQAKPVTSTFVEAHSSAQNANEWGTGEVERISKLNALFNIQFYFHVTVRPDAEFSMLRNRPHRFLGFFILFLNLITTLFTSAAAQPSFLPAVTFPAGGLPVFAIRVVDLNGDQKPDLVLATQGFTSGAQVLLNNGNGGFSAPVNYSSGGTRSFSVAVGDLNHDGKLDLAVTNVCSDSTCTRGSVGILLGNGDGTFKPAVTFDAGGSEAVSVATADVNGDGDLDLVLARCGTGSCPDNGRKGKVAVLLGSGDGTFRNAVNYLSGGTVAVSVAVADVNGDGKLDIVVANCGDLRAVACNVDPGGVIGVLLGRGDGTFQAATTYNSGGFGATSVVIADVNRDGNPDLIASNCGPVSGCGGTGIVAVLLGTGSGTFQSAVPYNSGGNDATSVAVADVNLDGRPDLLVSNFTVGSPSSSASMGVLLGNGDGTFQPAVTFGTGGDLAFSIEVADLNGDGSPDALVGGSCASPCQSGVVGVLLNALNPDVTPPTITLSVSPKILKPPDGRLVPIVISGTIGDIGSGLNASSLEYAVTDEYGEVQPFGKIPLGSNGSYSITVLLRAGRRNSDLDGRHYTIRVSARDNNGNKAARFSRVIVPH